MVLLSKLFNKETTQPVQSAAAPVAVVEQPVDYAQLEVEARATQDIEERLRLALEGPTAHIRQIAAEGIEDPEVLKRFLRDVRGKDKNVYRIIRQKCDALLEVEKAAEAQQASAVQVCEAIERHIHKPFDSIYVATLDHFVAQWQPLESIASAEVVKRSNQAIDQCRETIAAQLKRIATEAALADSVANADAQRSEILAALTTMLTNTFTATVEVTQANASEAERLSQRWQSTLKYKAAAKSDQQHFGRLHDATRALITKVIKQGTLQQQLDSLQALDASADDSGLLATLDKMLIDRELLGDAIPDLVTTALQAMAQRRQLHTERDSAQQHWQKQTAGLIRKALRALQDGQTAQAAGMRKAIEEKMTHGNALPASVANQLIQLDAKLNELRDWRSYAVAPKRQQLIDQMESLAAQAHNVTDPNELAERIKKLQEEWKLISKGNTDNTDAEWQRFHAAAQIAFQPCRDYFAKQAEQRQRNLELRQTLLARITTFAAAHDWEQPNWREVSKALREARQLWRSYQPVERVANKPLQEAFDVQLNALQTQLDGEYERNSTAKKRLIARAQGLLSTQGRDAVDELKRLQSSWKEIGPVAHENEQALWQEFRQHCDAVFEKRQQQHAEYVETLQSTKQQAEAICEQVEQVQQLSGAELIEAAKKLPELREAFNAIGELPKANARNIESRFDRALRACDQQISKQREIDKARAWNDVLTASDKIRAYRLALVDNAASEQVAALKQTAQDYIESSTLPKTASQAIKQQLMLDEAVVRNQNIATNAATLRELCIRAEILTDTPTLASDQSARRDYQMRRLTQGFGQGANAQSKDSIESLILEWIAVGTTRDVDYTALVERFNRCRVASR